MTVRIANCSGFYGDRLSAAREMVEGGPIDVLTGDYLAELTLTILAKDRRVDPGFGYAKTFPVQLRQVAATCLERGIKIVVNAGGLNPAACADACRAVYADLGLDARVAHIEGDDLMPRLTELQAAGEALEHLDRLEDGERVPLASLDLPIVGANAYLGAWGIAKALDLGADLVICPRVTDASLVVGPAVWHHGWARDDWDRLASAVVAGHILECGTQATGGNYAFFQRVDGLERPGFPLAEIDADGSFTVTKHPGTGGEVSVGTVTAQVLYEIAGPRYINPDVVARFDTIRLRQEAPDRVRVEGVQGEPPPPTTKVCINHLGGYSNRVTFLLTGLDIDAKARLAEETLWHNLGGREQFSETHVSLQRTGAMPGDLCYDTVPFDESFAFLTVSVKDPDPKKVGRRFSGKAVEMALASYPGFNLTTPPGKETPFGIYWPAIVASELIEHRVVFDGETFPIPPTPGVVSPSIRGPVVGPEPPVVAVEPWRQLPLGHLFGARSGDKGGNANLGVWAESDAAYLWLDRHLTVERLRQLIPDAAALSIDRYALPNLLAVNFVLRGFLGDGVAASLATDAQAKGLGEYLRAQEVQVPESLLGPESLPGTESLRSPRTQEKEP